MQCRPNIEGYVVNTIAVTIHHIILHLIFNFEKILRCLCSNEISFISPFFFTFDQIHQDQDDFGLGGHSDSLTTGHAGSRIGCCVIIAGAQGVTFSISLMILCLVTWSMMKW